MPRINVHLTFTCIIFQGLCFPCHASRDQSAPAGPCAVCGIQSPLSVSPALRRDKANALRSPRSRPKRGAQGAGASCGWLRVVSTGDPACARDAVRGGLCASPNPSDSLPPHTSLLPSQEPDQVPFWLWGQGQDGSCGRCTVLHGPRQVRPG